MWRRYCLGGEHVPVECCNGRTAETTRSTGRQRRGGVRPQWHTHTHTSAHSHGDTRSYTQAPVDITE